MLSVAGNTVSVRGSSGLEEARWEWDNDVERMAIIRNRLQPASQWDNLQEQTATR